MRAKRATEDILINILPIVKNANISYCTPTQVAEDCAKHRLYVLMDKDTPIAICSIVEEPNFNYTALKRLLLLNPQYAGKRCAESLIKHVCGWYRKRTLGCTPWIDNARTRHIFEKCGFTYQYTFSENYAFYKKA